MELGAGMGARPRGSERLRTAVVVVVTVVAIAAAALIIDNPFADGVSDLSLTGAVAAAPPSAGDAPPAFSLGTIDGGTVRLSDYIGHPLWLTFGASWCSECRAEAPDIEAAQERYGEQGLVILAVFQEDASSAAAYAARAGLTFTIAVDPDTRVASRYDILGIPTHVFIGADGVVRAFRVGALKPDDIDRYVTELLG